MSQNPYEPPTDSPDGGDGDLPNAAINPEAVQFRGGWAAILAIGVAGGVAFMAVVLFEGVFYQIGFPPIVFVGLLWFVALAAMGLLLRGASMPVVTRLLMALACTPIAFVLYAPICSFSAVVLSGGSYNSGRIPTTIASIFAFSAVLLLIAFITRTVTLQEHKKRETS